MTLATPPAIRPPGCAAFDPIRHDGSFGWCHAVEHRVYLMAGERCLCDHCETRPDGTRAISKDVIFVGNDLVELESTRAAALAAAIEQAATMPCAPKRAPGPAPPARAKPESKAQAPAPARKPGLLGFT